MKRKAWVVTVDMGYGHQRAAYPLKDVAYDHVITANSDKLLIEKEVHLWHRYREFYEGISRLTSIPVIGNFLFNLYDRVQRIAEFYPFKDLSPPTFPVLYLDYLIKRKKLNEGMFNYMKRFNLPLVTTFFMPAIAAEYFGVKKVYCVVTDTDISRVWVGVNPKKSKIIYLAPCETAAKRLKQYGVPSQNIIITGFPLPKENIGGKDMHILKNDLGVRLANLDPKKKYAKLYSNLAKQLLGKYYQTRSRRRLSLTLVFGGAGAQTALGFRVLKSLRPSILSGKIKVNIVAGTRLEVSEFYRTKVTELGLSKCLGKNVTILFAWNKPIYFRNFNQLLRETDILWSKPSEMSFFAGLGIPIIIAPPIGSHEYRNRNWLIDLGAGVVQQDPDCANEWLFDLIESGRLAEAAMQGFIEAPKMGTYNIEHALFSKKKS